MTDKPSAAALETAIAIRVPKRIAGTKDYYVGMQPTSDEAQAIALALDAFAARAVTEAQTVPIPMILFCPNCGWQHVDAPSPGWDNPPHKSHLCHACAHVWRPAGVITVGVAEIKTIGSHDANTIIRGQIRPVTEARRAALEEVEPVITAAIKWEEVFAWEPPPEEGERKGWLQQRMDARRAAADGLRAALTKYRALIDTPPAEGR